MAIDDYSIFDHVPHPGVGRLTTPIRRFAFAARCHLASMRPRRCWECLAILNGEAIGACTIFLGDRNAGLYDMSVLERFRNRGIGRNLVHFACTLAKDHGNEVATLIATNDGHRVYERVGFREVCRIGFFYTANP